MVGRVMDDVTVVSKLVGEEVEVDGSGGEESEGSAKEESGGNGKVGGAVAVVWCCIMVSAREVVALGGGGVRCGEWGSGERDRTREGERAREKEIMAKEGINERVEPGMFLYRGLPPLNESVHPCFAWGRKEAPESFLQKTILKNTRVCPTVYFSYI